MMTMTVAPGTTVTVDPEMISAIVAIITLVLALIELAFRSAGNRAEAMAVLYSKYLYIIQQIEWSLLSIDNMRKNREIDDHLIAYVRVHMVGQHMLDSIHEIEELAVTSVGSKDSTFVLKAMEFGGTAQSVITSINQFYQNIIEGTAYTESEIEAKYGELLAGFSVLKNTDAASEAGLITDTADMNFGQLLKSSLVRRRSPVLRHLIAIVCSLVIVFCVIALLY